MENGHKWSWKVLENAREKVLESHGTTLIILYARCKLEVVLSYYRWFNYTSCVCLSVSGCV